MRQNRHWRLAEDEDVVAKSQSLIDVVCHEDDGSGFHFPEGEEPFHDVFFQSEVEA